VTQHEFFTHVLKSLNSCGIPYMVTGSVGAMLYGEPRLTNDIDVVVEIASDQAEQLRGCFPAEDFYYPATEFIQETIRRRGQFNIIHIESGSKADLIVRKAGDFSAVEFSRKQFLEFTENFQAPTATPEDVILSKMRAHKAGSSEKHVTDILSILEISGDALDYPYLAHWAGALGLGAVWQSILDRRKRR
jgi:hypothetical protein